MKRVWLMKHAFIALAGGSGLIGIDPGNENELIGNLFLHTAKPGNVFQNRLTVIGGAGADDQNHFAAVPGEYVPDGLIPFRLDPGQLIGQRVLLLDILRDRQFSFKLHVFHEKSFSLCLTKLVYTLAFLT